MTNLPAATPSTMLTIFGAVEPNVAMGAAEGVAKVLKGALERRKLVARISGRDYVLVEGWTLLGSMLGVFAEVEWSRPTELADGWEARAVARNLAGSTIGAAEAMCTRTEPNWKGRDDYALRSMAQTRAIAKALRLPLGFIVHLAGFDPTPAEEIDEAERPRRNAPSVRQQIEEARTSRGLGNGALLAIAQEVGVKPDAPPSAAQLRKILAAVEALPPTRVEIVEATPDAEFPY